MPIGAYTVIEARDNEFISDLYHYKQNLLNLETAIEQGDDITQRVHWWGSAKTMLFAAIEIAVRKANNADNEQDKRDFKDWLVRGKDNIFTDLSLLIRVNPTTDEDIKAARTAEIVEYGDRLNPLIDTLGESHGTFSPALEGVRNELSQSAAICAAMLQRTGHRINQALKLNFVERLRSYLEQLARAVVEEEIEIDQNILDELNQRYLLLGQLGVVNAGVTSARAILEDAIAGIVERPDTLVLVETSIELRKAWEEMTLTQQRLQTLIAAKDRLLKKVADGIVKMGEAMSFLQRMISSFTKFIARGIGIVLSPIALAVLKVGEMCHIPGMHTAFNWYMDNTIRNKDAWVSLLCMVGVTIGITMPILAPLTLDGIMVGWGLGGALICQTLEIAVPHVVKQYNHDYKTEITTLRQQADEEVDKANTEYEEAMAQELPGARQRSAQFTRAFDTYRDRFRPELEQIASIISRAEARGSSAAAAPRR